MTRPVKELRGFKKITLKPGEKQTVTFDIDESLLAFYNHALEFRAEPGTFQVMIGGSSAQTNSASFELKQ
jgi:beta-glucosidase